MALDAVKDKSNKISQHYLSTKSRIRITDLLEAKKRNEKWAMLTSYDYVSARIFDQAGIPCILIGDSAAQTVLGYKSTLPITLDEMIPLARAVSTACKRALVVCDLPFGSYQECPQQALRSAVRLMKEANVHAVKLEGGLEYREHVQLLVQSGIPVMGHIGFTPQSEHALGGFKVQGRGAHKLDLDAKALEEAGAFSCVLELVPSQVSAEVTKILKIPTIGIGAGSDCDAQVLVWHDMAGFSPPSCKAGYMRNSEEKKSISSGDGVTAEETKSRPSSMKQLELEKVPKFVKRYASLSEHLYNAAIRFADEVAEGQFPSSEHSYS